MKAYICEICGDAYIGRDMPSECPFCGSRHTFIKPASAANPIFNQEGEISEKSKKFLEETYQLETRANAIYTCMAGKAHSYDVKAMYKRLAKIELEHATIVTKLLGTAMGEIKEEDCSNDMKENYKKTIELEDHASHLYRDFAHQVTEEKVRIFFTALTEVEEGHEELIKSIM